MYKLTFYVPPSHLEEVKSALFTEGAGTIGQYEKCCFQTLGQGQFQPMPGSNPHIGKIAQVELIEEYRVEILVNSSIIQKTIRALKSTHPYEEPAYDVIKIEDY